MLLLGDRSLRLDEDEGELVLATLESGVCDLHAADVEQRTGSDRTCALLGLLLREGVVFCDTSESTGGVR